MKEFKWVETITDKVWVALIIWIALAGIAKLQFISTIGGEILPAALEVIGLFVFLKALWKWNKRRKK